jgi:hypothetical protein
MIGSTLIQLAQNSQQRVEHTPKSKIGSASILQRLLPQLCVTDVRVRYQAITGLDYYMREETERLLERIETHCEMMQDTVMAHAPVITNEGSVITNKESVTTNINTDHQPHFTLRFVGNKCQLEGQYPRDLQNKLNQDTWLLDAFSWLMPNYLTLVHSLELVKFSYAYQRSRSKAAHAYAHFKDENNGLHQEVKVEAGKAQWHVLSALHRFHL